ncbi:hypothetical protein C8Q74DRAFT_1365958 [Fomes fomentarius]|nr:hypothetical protein C8Q74DRAFT_1365958 [Fomes fomentarius]
MSDSDPGPDAAELISTYQSLFVDNACAFAVLAFVIYDYAITLGQEIEMFWKRKFTGATALFLLNRYLLVLDYIFNIATIERSSEARSYSELMSLDRCVALVKTENVTYNLQYLPWAVFGALRAYALTRQNLPLSLFIGVLTLVPFGLNMSQFGSGLTGTIDPIFGCTEILPVDPNLAKNPPLIDELLLPDRFTIASRTTQIAADLLLIAITWVSLPRRLQMMNIRSSFATVLYQDGLIYFLLHLVFTMVSIVDPLNPVSNVTIFTLPITAVLVSRFLLDLQHANRETLHLDSQGEPGEDGHADSNIGSLVFERVVGSIASTIDFANGEEGEEDDDEYQEGRGRGAEMQELAKLSSAGSDADGSEAQSSGAVNEGDDVEVARIQMDARERDGGESRLSEWRVSSNRGSNLLLMSFDRSHTGFIRPMVLRAVCISQPALN